MIIQRVKSVLSGILVVLIQCYKAFVSPLLPAACRFYPTCSQYAAEAIKKHGPFKGSALVAKRLLRCHPFCEGGYDPVP
jgi:hypothetical protein